MKEMPQVEQFIYQFCCTISLCGALVGATFLLVLKQVNKSLREYYSYPGRAQTLTEEEKWAYRPRSVTQTVLPDDNWRQAHLDGNPVDRISGGEQFVVISISDQIRAANAIPSDQIDD